MRRTAWLGLLMGAGICVGCAQAQGLDGVVTATSGSLDLSTAQRETLEHSPTYRKALAQEQEASWGHAEALSEGFLPHVSVEGTYYLNNRYAKEGMALAPSAPSEALRRELPRRQPDPGRRTRPLRRPPQRPPFGRGQGPTPRRRVSFPVGRPSKTATRGPAGFLQGPGRTEVIRDGG
jgi:hypothetical protein